MSRLSTRRCRGVGIIEVLIALVVVSFGVLGMAGLQLTGMKHSNGGYNRAKAVLLAENLAARMRANRPAIDAGHYLNFDSDTMAADYCETKPDPYCQAYESTAAGSCNIEQMADFDLFSIACGHWSSADQAVDGVVDGLRGGRLTVDCESPCTAPLTSYTVLITWDENSGAGGNELDFEKRVQVRFNP